MDRLQFSKKLLLFFLPITTLMLFVSLSLYSAQLSAKKTILLNQEEVNLKNQQELLQSKIESLISDIFILASHNKVRLAKDHKDSNKLSALEAEFLAFGRIKTMYDQIRLLDRSGQELIRVNYNNGQPKLAEALQFKGDRYYFTDTLQLRKGEVFISPFDLNVENGKIEEPHKPVIRVGTPLFTENDQVYGIILLNYLGQNLLDSIERIQAKSPGKTALTNSDGYWLKGINPDAEWGFMIEERKNKTLQNSYPAAWQKITSGNAGQFETASGLFTYTSIFPLIDGTLSSTGSSHPKGQSITRVKGKAYRWTLLSFISSKQLAAMTSQLKQRYLLVSGAIAVIVFSLSSLLAFYSLQKEKADFALREANANIENIFNSSLPLCVTDKNHNIIMSNDMYESLFKAPDVKKKPIKCYDSIKCSNCESDNCAIKLIFEKGREKAICETTLTSAAGNKKHFLITSKPFKNSSGDLIGVLSNFQDVSDLKRLETEYAKTRNLESLGVVAGGIAHDFNNLLTAISGYVLLAKNMIDPTSKAAELLSESEKASLRAKKLTQRIITFSRGGTPLKKRTYISNFLVDAIKVSISDDKYTCLFDIEESLPKVEIDEGQILQVITSIISNAKEAMPDGGVIKTTARPYQHIESRDTHLISLVQGNYIQILIEDQGIGIPEKELPKIFDPYYSSKKLGAQKGVGLGLATAYSVITKHDGTIHITSSENIGTKVYVYIPVAGAQKVHLKKPLDESHIERNILIMDDEALIRNIAKEIIDHMHWRGAFAENGLQAVDFYVKAMEAGAPFDLVILDLSVPSGMGGLDTLNKIKHLDPNVKAVVSSGFADNNIMRSYEKYGFCAAIPKPYTPKILSEVINRVLEA